MYPPEFEEPCLFMLTLVKVRKHVEKSAHYVVVSPRCKLDRCHWQRQLGVWMVLSVVTYQAKLYIYAGSNQFLQPATLFGCKRIVGALHFDQFAAAFATRTP